MRRRHQWGGGIDVDEAKMMRRHWWGRGIDKEEELMKSMHWWEGGIIEEEASMRRRHQLSGCIVEEKASMRRRRDLDMNMKIIWGMLILITILIRKPTWIGPTFANNVPATRVAAGAVVGAAERARREVFVIQLSLSHGSLEWVVNDPSCILCHVGTVNFSSHQCNGHCINTHQTYCMAVSTGGVGALPGNWSPEFGSTGIPDQNSKSY